MAANDINSITPQQAAGVLLLSLPDARKALQLAGHRCDEHMLAHYVRDAVQAIVDRGDGGDYEEVREELRKRGTPTLNQWQCVWGNDGEWIREAIESAPEWLFRECNGIDSAMCVSIKGGMSDDRIDVC